MPNSADAQPQNTQSTARLRDLIAQLQPADYRLDLGGGWTVGFALAHLAFWDARHAAALDRFHRSGLLPAEDRFANPGLEALIEVCATPTIGALALQAAAALDTEIGRLSAAQRDAVRDAGFAHLLDRWPHREEHRVQIESAR